MLAISRIAVALIISAAVLATSQLFGGNHATARLILAVCLAIYVWMILECVTEHGERIFALSAALFFVVIILVPGIFHCAAGAFPFYSKSYPDNLVNAGATLMLAFTVPAAMTYIAFPKPKGSTPSREIAGCSASAATVAIFVLLAVSLAIFATRSSVFTLRRLDLGLVGEASPVDLIVVGSARFGAFLAFLINAYLVLKVRKLGFIWLLPVTGAAAYLLNNPANIARFPLLALIICAIFVLFQTSTRGFKSLYASAYFIGLLTIFPLLSFYARGARGQQMESGFSSYYIKSGDFDGLQSLINIAYWINQTGFKWGHQLLGSALVFIPRSVWPDKSEGTGGAAARYVGYPFTNISAPLPGEIYSDFGYIGVILSGAIFGWILTILDRKAANKRRLSTILALGMAAGFMPILLRGSLIGVIGTTGLAILLGWLVGRIIERQPGRAPLGLRKGMSPFHSLRRPLPTRP